MDSQPLPIEFAQAIFDPSEAVWRCDLDGWEIETDDGLQGYCTGGHHFVCLDIQSFVAADETYTDDGSDTTSEGSEKPDQHDEAFIVDDEDLKNPYQALVRCIKDLDKSDCDKAMLMEALDEIDQEDNGCEVLIGMINSIDYEEVQSETEDDTSEEDTIVSDGEEVISDEEGILGEQAKMSIKEGTATDEIATESQEEELTSEDTVEKEATSELDIHDEPVEDLLGLVQFPTRTSRDPSSLVETSSNQMQDAVTLPDKDVSQCISTVAQVQRTAVKKVVVTEISDSEAEMDHEMLQHQLWFDEEEIEFLCKNKLALIQDEIEVPSSTSEEMDDGADGEASFEDLEELKEQLFIAIQRARWERNEAKKVYQENLLLNAQAVDENGADQ